MIIFVEQITPRVHYVFRYIFRDMLMRKYQLTNDITYFKKSPSPKINYTRYDFSDILNIKPQGLLFEKDIKPQDIKVSEWQGVKIFFQTRGEDNTRRKNNTREDDQSREDQQTRNISQRRDPGTHGIPFDIFSAIFFLISRYEEYLPFKPDKYGRFEANQSLAYQHGFLRQPLVDQWVKLLKEELMIKYPEMALTPPPYQYLSTIDIDSAFAFRHKGILRTLLGSIRQIISGETGKLKYRYRVVFNKRPDPFDVFSKLMQVHQDWHVRPIWFFLVGKLGRFDKNISIRKKQFRLVIKRIGALDNIGIHPSYQSNLHGMILRMEINTLKGLLKKPVIRSRQHYLKMSLPVTYRRLIKAGIQEDYSMGYASHAGFRAGTCTPFYFFDLKTNKETPLRVYPFQVMDACLKHYMQLEPEKALAVIQELNARVREVGGTFISVWHNESISGTFGWEGWEQVYEDMVKQTQNPVK